MIHTFALLLCSIICELLTKVCFSTISLCLDDKASNCTRPNFYNNPLIRLVNFLFAAADIKPQSIIWPAFLAPPFNPNLPFKSSNDYYSSHGACPFYHDPNIHSPMTYSGGPGTWLMISQDLIILLRNLADYHFYTIFIIYKS